MTVDNAAEPMIAQDPLSVKRTDLAMERTRAALDRTLLAWNRTSMSMITFGFTLYQFFRFLSQSQAPTAVSINLNAPRYLSIALIPIGTLWLMLAMWHQWLRLSSIWSTGLSRASLETPLAVDG